MEATNNAERVRTWLKTGPGLVIGDSPHACYQKVWGGSGGLGMSLGDLTDCLHVEGFRPDQRGGHWVLVLPDRPNK